MNADAIAATSAVAEDSALSFALLFAPPDLRRIVVALLDLRAELQRGAREPGEPEIARVRVAWWHEEIDRFVAGSPRHPLTSRLADVANWSTSDLNYLLQMAHESTDEVDRCRLGSREDLVLHAFRTDGCALALAVRKSIEPNRSPVLERAGSWLGRAIRLSEIVRGFNTDFVAGRIYIPEDLMREHGARLPRQPLRNVADALERVFADVLDTSDRYLDEARHQWATTPHPALVWHYVATDLYRAINLKLRVRMNKAAPERIAPSAFSTLFRSWLAARRASKLFPQTRGVSS